MMTVRDLKMVRALDAHRNFARAAEDLGMSQPNLSRALARLERSVGALMFERSRTAVVPTVYADIVLERCDVLVDGFEDLARALELKREEVERGIRISVGPFAAEAVGLESFAAHATASRTFIGRLVVRDWRTCLEDVLERRSDLAVTDTRSAEDHPELDSESLGGGPVSFFCDRRHPLAGRSDVDWSDLMRFPWAVTLMQGRWLELLPQDLGTAGRRDPATGDFVPAICVDSFAAMVTAVRTGRAVSVASPAFIREELKRGDFVLLPPSEPWMRMDYGLVWRRGQPWSPSLRRFAETLRRTQAERDFEGAEP